MKRQWLIDLRNKRKLTQLQVAEKSKISQQFYNFVENGKKRPSPEIAQVIAKVLKFKWTRFYE